MNSPLEHQMAQGFIHKPAHASEKIRNDSKQTGRWMEIDCFLSCVLEKAMEKQHYSVTNMRGVFGESKKKA